jgi:hypothetical protein
VEDAKRCSSLKESNDLMHHMESNAMRISSLKRTLGVFLYRRLSWMIPFLMKALWELKTRSLMKGPRKF